MHYLHVFAAGTFDGLHAGHRATLTRAFEEGERVTIGITTDAFVRTYKLVPLDQLDPRDSSAFSRYARRKQALEAWLCEQGFSDRATVIPISDPHEPAASMRDLDALIVTAENRETGEHINALRQGSTLPLLTLIEVPMVAAEDGAPVSSTRMRNGEIDHNGRLVMPESMRSALGKPQGNVITHWTPNMTRRDRTIITVGDIATKTFLDAGIRPALAIIDGKVGRKPFGKTLKMLQLQKVKPFRFKSGPGFISKKAIQAIQAALKIQGKQHHVILIDGEEDLLVLPALIHAPLGSILYYGQRGEGLVEVVVTGEAKRAVAGLLSRFR